MKSRISTSMARVADGSGMSGTSFSLTWLSRYERKRKPTKLSTAKLSNVCYRSGAFLRIHGSVRLFKLSNPIGPAKDLRQSLLLSLGTDPAMKDPMYCYSRCDDDEPGNTPCSRRLWGHWNRHVDRCQNSENGDNADCPKKP